MDRQPTLETERLVIRPLVEEDREALDRIASDPAVWEQHPIHDRWQREVFDAFFDDGFASGGSLAVVRKSDKAVIGHTRYDKFDPEDTGPKDVND